MDFLSLQKPVLPQLTGVRFGSHFPLSLDTIRERVLLVLKLYAKVDPEKVHIIYQNRILKSCYLWDVTKY